MHTLAFVRLCRETSDDIKNFVNAPNSRYTHSGSYDYEQREHDVQQLQTSIKYVMDVCTNPTLPSYQNLVELAKKHKLTTRSTKAA